MRIRTRWSSTALALAVISMGSACADDTPATTINFGDGTSTTASEPTTSFTTADSTATEGVGTGSGTGSTGETEETTTATTGEEVAPGQSASQLVTAGDRSTSRSYVLVFTVGQPSKLQSTHESASYRLRGGLVGANGSPP